MLCALVTYSDIPQALATYAETLTLRGICPRCQGPTTSQYTYGIPGSGTKGLFSSSVARRRAGGQG
ncbi:hypothetical protein [Streptomyces sp. 4F14]|uniref:hypothetical protein n=1 Tax=Streptomyces sp. 4F14 TaxID=3394380 RepID=UPI003A8AE5F4